ncbi:translation factor GUF1: mitochondrial-like isoform X2 [Dinothrombium tinctorium]|uniref:Translation factor GUF1 homolog, mitochondrial n=1 Tax=Dinothrombium tinctorium TaxID=1965070 RepID=A0A3S3PSR1_9ACAR|nr:translation factor GUF1: mitochondrial-like isoform X2 [Dinothrombium tinctorium]
MHRVTSIANSAIKRSLFTVRLIRKQHSITENAAKLSDKKVNVSCLLLSFSSARSQFDSFERFSVDKIRNFSIIAHIDHGKSTLSDRLLELTGLISKDDKVEQYLDKLQVERERGITVKAQTVSLIYRYKNEDYLLNLIDTPGHVDFSFEVWRSLSACQGAVLLVDANSGVQAQTVAHFNHALLSDITIIPVINKIDMKNANPDAVCEQLEKLFCIKPNEVFKISAKQGTNVEQVLQAVIEQIPAPDASPDKPTELFIFDSWFDTYKGVVALVSVLNGKVKVGDKFVSLVNNKTYDVKTIGIMHPNEKPTEALFAGQVGFMTANLRDTSDVIVGDILITENTKLTSKPSKQPKIPEAKPMLYAGIFPCDQSQTVNLKAALEKLVLQDRSVTITNDVNPALGYGWRLGFLGLLHMEVFSQRLDQEFDAPTVITAPSVTYKVKIKGEKNIKQYGSEIITVTNPLKLPDVNIISEYYEPMVIGTIIVPDNYFGVVSNLCMEKRGEQKESTYIDQTRMMLKYRFPLSEIVVDFYDNLKSVSSGYASFDYESDGYEETKLVRLDFLINGEMVEELSHLVYAPRARQIARELCEKLVDIVPRQQFKVAIQATINTKVICRENVKPYRKDVGAKIKSGHDRTRLAKLLARQKEGKERLRRVGQVEIPRDSFIKLLRK